MFMHAVIPENRLVSRDQRPKTFPSLQINFLSPSQECACSAWASSWSWFILKGVGGGLFIGLKSDHPASCDLVSLSATVHTSHSRPGFRNNLKGGSESHRLLEIIKSGHAGKIQKASAWFWYFLCIRTYVTSTVDRENYFSARPMVNVSQNCQFYANLNLQQHCNSIAWGDKSRGQTWNCCHFCFVSSCKHIAA